MSKRRTRRPVTDAGDARLNREQRRQRDDELASAAREGDGEAFRRLVDSWIDPAYDRVSRRGVSPDAAGSVLTRAFRTARHELDEGAPGTFASWVTRAATVEAHAAREAIPAISSTDNRRAVERLTRGTDPVALAADEAVAAVLWQAADVFGEQGADLLDLHWRYGLDPDEIEQVLGLGAGEADDMIAKMPRGFAAAVRTRLLWGTGTPDHDVLAAELAKHGVDTFDARAVRIINKHIRECAVCRARSLVALPAVDVFAAVPMESAPTTLRKEVVVATTVGAGSALAGETVPPGPGPEVAAAAGAAFVGASLLDTEGVLADSPTADAATTDSRVVAPVVDAPVLDEPPAVEPLVPAAPEPPTPEPLTEPTPLVAAGGAPPADATPYDALVPAAAGAGLATAAVGTDPGGPTHEPVTSRRDTEGEPSSKRWVAIGVAAAIVLIGGIAFAATRGGDDGTEIDTASADSTTTTTERPSSTTTTTRPTTTTSTAPDTTTVTTASTPVTTAGGGGFTPPPTIPTTTTTGPLDLRVEFYLQPSQIGTGYNQATAPRLRWTVSSGRAVNVTVTGPGLDPSTGLTGDTAICPLGWGTGTCSASPDTYYYRLVVEENGQIWRDDTRQLKVVP